MKRHDDLDAARGIVSGVLMSILFVSIVVFLSWHIYIAIDKDGNLFAEVFNHIAERFAPLF